MAADRFAVRLVVALRVVALRVVALEVVALRGLADFTVAFLAVALVVADVGPAARETPYKLNDLYLAHGAIREIALEARLVDILAELNSGVPIIWDKPV